MRLGIVSDCVHYKTTTGSVGTEVHILLRQFEALSAHFTETVICCPFDHSSANKVLTLYSKNNIRFIPVPNVGGDSVKEKLKIAFAIPKWLTAFKKVNASSDVVYQRFPNNLNIPGFFYFYFKRKNVFATFTGPWIDNKFESFTYRFQKWLLKKYFRGPVWVYMDKKQVGNNIFGGFSPSYSRKEWDEETNQVEERMNRIRKEGIKTFRLISVGTLDDRKNHLAILKACVILKSRNFPFYVKIVGDGPNFNQLKDFIGDNKLEGHVELAGKKSYGELRQLYRETDFIVQAPLSEGFGKVPIEGFFHGVTPVINDIDLARYMTGNGERGFLFNAKEPETLYETLTGIQSSIDELPDMISRGRAFAKSQTLEAWAEGYYKTVMSYCERA